MAREVKLWVTGIVAACCVLAIAFLPLRGTRTTGRTTLFSVRIAQATPARMRAQAVAEQWRVAHVARRLAEQRVQLRTRLAPSTPSDRPLVLVSGSDSASRRLQQRLEPKLDSAWQDLGLSETKISVAAVFDPADVEATEQLPREESSITYLLPDSTDRTWCVVRVVENRGWRNAILRDESRMNRDWLRSWVKGLLGPCAFFAAYGAPAKPVRRWLLNRGFDLALYPSWDGSAAPYGRTSSLRLGDEADWGWDYIYHQSFPAVACLAGRSSGCREAVLAGATDERAASRAGIVTADRRFWQRQRLVGGTTYLSDVAHAVGRERFLEFWNSALPVDTALARALRQPVGVWTAAWQRRLVGAQLPLGPSAPTGSSILATLLAIAAVTMVAVTAGKRQVR